MSAGIIDELIVALTKLPGIGRKTAQRLSFFILSMPKDEALSIAEAIVKVKETARFCAKCFNISSTELCPICEDSTRDKSTICVVEEPANILAFERSRYKGLYHVLLGSLSPSDGITPDKLKIAELVRRLKTEPIAEVILATNPNTKGELTASYIAEQIKPLNIKVTRIACGLPIGSDIEFADEVTLLRSLEGRKEVL